MADDTLEEGGGWWWSCWLAGLLAGEAGWLGPRWLGKRVCTHM